MFLAVITLGVLSSHSGRAGAEADALVARGHFVAVTDGIAKRFYRGCCEATLADSSSGAVVARPPSLYNDGPAPGQIAATSDGLLLAWLSTANLWYIRINIQEPAEGRWVDATFSDGRKQPTGGAIAISPDDTTMLVAEKNSVWKYDVANISTRSLGPVVKLTIDPDLGMSGHPFEATVAAAIEFTADSRTAYVVVNNGFVYTLDVGSMTWRGDPAPYAVTARRMHYRARRTFAALSPDERWLVINTGDEGGGRGALNLVDLHHGRTDQVEADGLRETWGVDFNYSAANRGLLAVHGRFEVGVYDVSGGRLKRIASTRIAAPGELSWPAHGRWMARFASLAWSGDGTRLIANQGGDKEWRIFELSSAPPGKLASVAVFDGCTFNDLPPDIGGQGYDVVTLQKRPTLTITPTPSDTPTVTLTPSLTPTPTSTVTPHPPSVTPSASPPATALPTATKVPSPVYLPLALNERCTPDKRRADVALVIDASSSMEQPTSAGRTKIAAAIEAAGVFLDQLQLDAGDQAAIVAFNADAWLVRGLTSDGGALDSALDSIRTDMQTCLVCGVDVAADELAGSRRDPGNAPVMIVLTDGLSNPRPASEAVTRAEEAREDGVVVYTIGLGDTLDFDALTRMASRPEYFYLAPDAEDLARIYRLIAVEIPCPGKEFWGGAIIGQAESGR